MKATNTTSAAPARPNGRMGLAAYARVLALLTKPTPQTEVMKATGRSAQRVREMLWRMEQLGLVWVCDWRDPKLHGSRGMLEPVFVLGSGRSLPYPRPIKRKAHGASLPTCDPRPELIAFASIVRTLKGGATRDQLRKATGVAHHRIGNLLGVFRDLGLIHTQAWLKAASHIGSPAEVLAWGPGLDAARPPRKTRKEVMAAYQRRRRVRDGAHRLEIWMGRNVMGRVTAAVTGGDTWTASSASSAAAKGIAATPALGGAA